MSTMLQQAAQKQHEDLGVVASGRYVPPVAAKAPGIVPRSQPKALSSSLHSAPSKASALSVGEKKPRTSVGGSLSMFNYVSKRPAVEATSSRQTTAEPSDIDTEDIGPPAAKISRPADDDEESVLLDVETNASTLSFSTDGKALSPIVTGNLHRTSSASDQCMSMSLPSLQDIENFPPKPQARNAQQATSSFSSVSTLSCKPVSSPYFLQVSCSSSL